MTPSDLLDTVRTMLRAKWPDRTVYTDPCPAKFKRPSFTLLVNKAAPSAVNFCLVQWDVELAVIVSGAVDAYHDAAYESMLTDRQAAADLFAAGTIACGDRHPTVDAQLDGQDLNEAYLLLTFSWTDARPDTEPEHGAAEDFAISVSAK